MAGGLEVLPLPEGREAEIAQGAGLARPVAGGTVQGEGLGEVRHGLLGMALEQRGDAQVGQRARLARPVPRGTVQGQGSLDARGALWIPAEPHVDGAQVVQRVRLGLPVAHGTGGLAGPGVHGDRLREVAGDHLDLGRPMDVHELDQEVFNAIFLKPGLQGAAIHGSA